MDPGRRADLKRYGAPTAFLAAVTIAVLLIKAGLNGGTSHGAEVTVPTVPSTAPVTTRRTPTLRSVATTTVARYYTIQSGDTLGSVATRENTTVAELVRLNPGVDPAALHVGQRIRVG